MFRSSPTLVTVLALLNVGLFALPQQPPVQQVVPAPAARPLVYPPNDPAKDIATALASAAKDGRHVLLDFGADWCPDCRVLGALFDSDAVKPFADANFHIVHIDVGRRDKNVDLVEKYTATSNDWIPAVVVLDPAGKTIARTDELVRLSRRTTPEQLLAQLQQWAPKRPVAQLSSFTQHGVKVDVVLERDSLGQAWLASTFAPQAAGTYLYGKDLPSQGLDGLGRPTRLAITSSSASSAIVAAGPVIANRPIIADRIELLRQTFPVYPAGPVTLRMPVTVRGANGAAAAEVAVSYMGCGANGCLPPVERTLAVVVPRQ